MKKKSILLSLALLLVFAVPVLAVFKEKNLPKTLDVLLFELKNDKQQAERMVNGNLMREDVQRKKLSKLMEDCNELSIMLYSQPQNYTFDLTYALDQVTKQYQNFDKTRLPYNDIVSYLEVEIDRYQKMIETLESLPPRKDGSDTLHKKGNLILTEHFGPDGDSLEMPPLDSIMEARPMDSLGRRRPIKKDDEDDRPFVLDSAGMMLRDSCLTYAKDIVGMYWTMLLKIDADNSFYSETDTKLKETYDYALDRYRAVQEKIFVEEQDNYFKTLGSLKQELKIAQRDWHQKYTTHGGGMKITSEWRGMKVMLFMAAVFFFILLAFALANFLMRIVLHFTPFKSRFPKAYDFIDAHKYAFMMLVGVIIFALAILITNMSSSSNFMHMAAPILAEYALLLGAICLSLIIRLHDKDPRGVLSGYMPLVTICLIIIWLRVIFIPNSIMNLIFPPLLLLFTIWQAWWIFHKRYMARRDEDGKVVLDENGDKIMDEVKLPEDDYLFTVITLAVLTISTVVSWMGYVMLALVFIVWWSFQLTVIMMLHAIGTILARYYENHIKPKEEKSQEVYGIKGANIASWLYYFIKMVVIPVLTVWSIPLCVFWAGNVFDLSGIIMEYFNHPFVNIDKLIHLSASKILTVISLFFVFKFLCLAIKSFYRKVKMDQAIKKYKNKEYTFKKSELNFTVANNIISLCCWGLYVIIAFLMLQIPTSALTIVTTGLATGIGFALKDVLNNFFYGVQLMSGRLRVGDVIECDGIRGTVESMSYQTTQIKSNDGAIIAFPNTTLFSKNFKNLTKGSPYELLQIPVGVKYGTDVETVRQLLTDALKVLQKRDKYGRNVVEGNSITVKFDSFGDNSVNLLVSQKVTVDERYKYAAAAKEIIYNTLNENGIEIPFPQRDLYIKQVPASEEEK